MGGPSRLSDSTDQRPARASSLLFGSRAVGPFKKGLRTRARLVCLLFDVLALGESRGRTRFGQRGGRWSSRLVSNVRGLRGGSLTAPTDGVRVDDGAVRKAQNGLSRGPRQAPC
jgi:hypothetical protein